jgi:hypothetical protein
MESSSRIPSSIWKRAQYRHLKVELQQKNLEKGLLFAANNNFALGACGALGRASRAFDARSRASDACGTLCRAPGAFSAQGVLRNVETLCLFGPSETQTRIIAVSMVCPNNHS